MTQHMATWSRANSKWQSMHLVSEYSVGLPPFHTGQLTILIHTGRSPSFLMTACVIHTKLYLSNAISTVSMATNIFKTQDNICITSRFTPLQTIQTIQNLFCLSRVTGSYLPLVELGCHPRGAKHDHDLASGVQCARLIKSAEDNLSLAGFLGCELTLNRIKSNWVMTRRLCSPGETCLDESPRAGCGLFCLLGSGTPSPPLSATSTPSVNQTVIINSYYESP